MVLFRLSILTFLLFIIKLSVSQTGVGYLEGKILNADNGNAMVNVNVVLKKNGNFINVTSSNKDGLYNFQKGIKANEYEVSLGVKGIGNVPVGNVEIIEGQRLTLNILVGLGYIYADSDPLPDFNTESYDFVKENDFQKVFDEPLSTFSVDVDAASYGIVKQFIMYKKKLPPKYILRIEEMINYFDYDYPMPNKDNPISIYTEMSDCPWNTNNKLIHIGLQGFNIANEDLPPNNLVFLIDVSGSMQEKNKLPLVKQSLKLLVEKLNQNDKISIVIYAGASGLVLPATPVSKKEKIIAIIDSLAPGGSTAGSQGIQLAYEIARKNFLKNGNNRVVLATDGDFNVGPSSDAELVSLITEKRETGVYLTILGFGMGNYKDDKMEMLSNYGNGNYYYINDEADAVKYLVDGLSGTVFTIANDVKVQVEFNPAFVYAYRLIGYENRSLKNNEFDNDKIDAGEVGSGHTVTALYEIIPKTSNTPNDKNKDLKYQKNKTNETVESSEVMTVKLQYKIPGETESKMIEYPVDVDFKHWDKSSETYKFSAAVAMFGMILNGSKFILHGDLEQVQKIAEFSKGKDFYGYKKEFITLVQQAIILNKVK